MSYDGKVLRRALARFDEAKQRREAAFDAREREVFARAPRVAEITTELSGTMAKIISRSLARGTDPRGAIEVLREENSALQAERRSLLLSLGHPADYLDRVSACPLCGDTGWRGSEMCSCLKAYYVREQQSELSQLLDLRDQSFDAFRLDYYSDTEYYGRRKTARENMERVYDVCSGFAHGFPSRVKNLLLSGDPGLGKTFLSAAIAREVSEKGFSVVYDTAAHIFARCEAQKFDSSDETADEDVERLLRCDLLIADDLGTEMTTGFVQSALYRILNTRLLEDRATIVSTNLSPDELGRRYGAAVLSRIRGEYECLAFYGEDIRRLKKRG